ncbi:MAG: ABC transporter ATP-binding protein [Clostridia bacterium]|nr:ABC transporter ATP-binding protein [Clostridia bacterium]
MLRALKKYRVLAVISLVLLLLQAVCDLLLPSYTAKLIDTGIQNNGISYAVPLQMCEEDKAQLSLFFTDEEQLVFDDNYVFENGTYALKDTQDETLSALESVFIPPLFVLHTVRNVGVQDYTLPASPTEADKEAAAAARTRTLDGAAVLGENLIRNSAVAVCVSMFSEAGGDAVSLRTQYLKTTGLQMLGLTLAMAALAVLLNYVTTIIGTGVGRDLRKSVFEKVLSFSGGEMNSFSVSSLITRTTNDVQHVQMVIMIALRAVLYAPLMSIGGTVMVMRTSPAMSWIVALAVGIILAALGILSVVLFPKFKIMQKLVDGINRISREMLSGVQVIRAFGRETEEERRFEEANTKLMKTSLFTNRTLAFLAPILNLMMYGFSALIVRVAAPKIDAGTMEVGDMTAFTTYAIMIAGGFLMVSMVFVYAPRALVAVGRIEQVLSTQPLVTDCENAIAPETCEGVVEFRNVSFAYPDTEAETLKNISFTAYPGQTFAVVGGTGCGKSTLLRLLERFYDPTDGQILLDGTDIRDMTLHSLREKMGYVPQKGVLFSGTIGSNIAFGTQTLSDAQRDKAAEVAQASEFISSKPDGFDSNIAQGGTNVSGGQKQRLSIARAIAVQPKIYLFDDSFSALDYKTDAVLRAALRKEVADATVIIVAQRLSTVLHAEQILVLDEGRAVGLGTHEELLRTCPVYRNIAASQLSAAELGLGEEATDGEA